MPPPAPSGCPRARSGNSPRRPLWPGGPLEEELRPQPPQPPLHQPGLRLQLEVVAPDQGDHPLPQVIVQPQAAPGRHPPAPPRRRRVRKVAHPSRSTVQHPGFPTSWSRAASRSPGSAGTRSRARTQWGVDVIAVVGIALVKAHGRASSGQHLPGEDLRAVQQHPARRRAADQPLQLLRHPLPGDAGQLGGAGSHAGGRPLLSRKSSWAANRRARSRRRASSPKRRSGSPHAADDPRRQVGPASEGVSQAGGAPRP